MDKTFRIHLKEIVTPPNRSIIVYDGYCRLCDGSVSFVIKRDPRNRFCFAANQSEQGQAVLKKFGIEADEHQTVYLIEDGQVYRYSGAALRIARHLTFPWPLFYIFIIIPPVIRDAVYRFIARRRTQWFGRNQTCRLPKPEERERFLDA